MNTKTALDYAQETRDGFLRKADAKKSSSEGLFISIILFSLAPPLLIAYGGDCKWLSKIIPSCLTIIVAGLTSWMQLRNPQKLWSVYRNAQRHIEDNITKYNYKVDEYAAASNPDSLLAQKVAQIALAAHNEWVDVLPSANSSIAPQVINP